MMFYRAFKIVLNFVTILYCVTGESLITKKNEKRIGARNNYQMCLDSFAIHRDKIIKTHDSRDMGAKYINEIDVDSRDECLKYCCDTEGCDVFIFEEKKPGSCYLFQCGPLHDFKCKFTSHANYSSAVRTNYNTQSNVQSEEEIRISQQEHELKSLRNLVESAPVEDSFTEPSIKLAATLAPKLTLTTVPPVKQACSRNQYECRSSGDCIAIYNVCDSIPQCADGSDEAPDLVCPTEKITISPSIVQGPPLPPPLPVDIIKYQQMMDQHKSLAPLYGRGPENNVKPWELSNLIHQVVPQQTNLLYPAQQIEVPQSRKSYSAPGYQWDYQPLYEQNKDIYSPVNSFRDQNNMNVNYEQDQSHIFNHKGSSVIEQKDGDSGIYLDLKHPYISHFSPPNRGPWQDIQARPSPSVMPNIQHQQDNEAEKSVISSTTPPCDTSHEDKSLVAKDKGISKPSQITENHTIHEKLANKNNGKSSTVKSDTPKYNHIQAKESKDHKSLILIEDHTREHIRNNIIAEHFKHSNENEALRPKGAVISLALGLTITAITATLIACRLRVVRRRGRRHGPYAHDADYLVNGMYL